MGILTKMSEKRKKERRSFDEFVNQGIIPTLTFSTTVDMAESIGIDSDTLFDVFKKSKNTYEVEKDKQIFEFLLKAKSYTSDKYFNDRVINKITFIRDYGVFSIEENKLVGKYQTKNKIYQLEIEMLENKLTIKNSFGNKKSVVVYKQLPTGKSLIKYEDESENIHDLKDKTSINQKNLLTIEGYNEDGIEEYRYEKEKEDNYYVIKETGEKVIHESSPFENYTNKNLYYRAGKDKILVRWIKLYTYPEDNKFIRNMDVFLIGKNYSPDSKKLQKGGDFIWYEKDLHEQYKNQEITLDDIWNLRGEAYQKRKK